ncbi:MAG: hypothetical protein ACU85V_04440 [Gammaproteobacteria bacterium]
MARAPYRKPSWRLLERLRYQSHSGRMIRRHRALRRLDFEPASVLHPLVMVGAAYAVLFLVRRVIAAGWAGVMAFWLPRLGLPGELGVSRRELHGLTVYEVPYPQLRGTAPDGDTLLHAAAACLVLMLLAYLLGRGRALPLAYLVWAGCLVELIACGAFALGLDAGGQTIATHVTSGFEFALVLAGFTPLMLAFSFYVFDYPLRIKALGTLVIIGGLLLVAPFQYLVHVVLIDALSLVVMPPLFVLFGLLFDVAVLIALYAWVVSWEP